MKNKCFCILTHFLTPRITALIARSRFELSDDWDVRVMGYFSDSTDVPDQFSDLPESVVVRHSRTLALGYPKKGQQASFTPKAPFGDFDLPLITLIKDNPQYETVWMIEGDVDYSGGLKDLVDHLGAIHVDLLATNIRTVPPGWHNKIYCEVPDGWAKPKASNRIAQLSAVRISRAAVEGLDEFYRQGGNGHYEWSLPYVVQHTGGALADIRDFPLNGRSLYTSTLWANCYFPGTFRIKPMMSRMGRRKNTLWHPVKDRNLSWREKRDVYFAAIHRTLRSGVGMIYRGVANRLVPGRRRAESGIGWPGNADVTPDRPSR